MVFLALGEGLEETDNHLTDFSNSVIEFNEGKSDYHGHKQP
jgi:hypothetical protein